MISSGENERVEFKALVKGPSEARQRLSNEFLETVSSFSNKLGGLIIIGVNDERELAGDDLDSPESLQDIIHRWTNPRVEAAVNEVNHRGKRILLVRVPEGGNKPYAAIDVSNGKDSRFYVRIADKDVLMSREDLDEIHSKKNGPFPTLR